METALKVLFNKACEIKNINFNLYFQHQQLASGM